MDGRMDGWMDELTGGQTGRQVGILVDYPRAGRNAAEKR
jgi:hypothetical protein